MSQGLVIGVYSKLLLSWVEKRPGVYQLTRQLEELGELPYNGGHPRPHWEWAKSPRLKQVTRRRKGKTVRMWL